MGSKVIKSFSAIGIKVNKYGRCTNSKDPCRKTRMGNMCSKALLQSHKFYLAFENAFCEDYITGQYCYIF